MTPEETVLVILAIWLAVTSGCFAYLRGKQ